MYFFICIFVAFPAAYSEFDEIDKFEVYSVTAGRLHP